MIYYYNSVDAIKIGKLYPKSNVPKEEVLLLRAQRKSAKREKKNLAKAKEKVLLFKEKKTYTWQFRFRLQKGKQDYKDEKISLHVSHSSEHDTFLLKVKEPTRDYIDWLWRQMQLKIVPMEWALKIFPNAKEQTESVAALFGVRDLVPFKESTVVVVADGSTPRCAGLMAFFAREVISIDPTMKAEFTQVSIPNLQCVASTIEEWVVKRKELPIISNPVVIIAIHAHVTFQSYLQELLQCIKEDVPVVILAVSCCVDLYLTPEERELFKITDYKEYDDWAIQSPCRSVRRWTKNIK